MALGSVTISRTFIRPPHFEQTVTSTAKTRERRFAQLSRRGVVIASWRRIVFQSRTSERRRSPLRAPLGGKKPTSTVRALRSR